MAGIDDQLGQYEKALEEDQTALRLDPANSSNYADVAADYIYLNRLNEAHATVEQALANNLDSPKLRKRLYQLAFLRNDTAEMLHQVAWAASKPGIADVLLALEAETTAYSGRLTKARELSRQAIVAALNAGERETAATYQAFAALRESLLGNRRQAGRQAAEALRLSTGREVQAVAALALAFAGEFVQSEKLLTALAREFPEDTIVRFNYLPMIYAQLALDSGDSRKAIATSDVSVAYELGDHEDRTLTTAMYPVFVRAQAYLGAGDGQSAAIEFQKIIDHSGITLNRPIGALAHLGLARAYVTQGETVKARAAYRDFLELWKGADPNIPVLKQAKAENAKLRN